MKIHFLRLVAIFCALFLSVFTASALTVDDLPGKAAPQWTLKGADGNTVHLSDFKGKIVLLDFWATWCGPCKAAMPSIQKISKIYENKGVVVIGINAWEEDPKLAIAYMKEQKYDYHLVLGGDQVAATYHVEGIPTLVIVNDKGIVAEVHVGYDPNLQKKLSSSLDRLIASR